jgi:hypothetical protein
MLLYSAMIDWCDEMSCKKHVDLELTRRDIHLSNPSATSLNVCKYRSVYTRC